MSQSGDNSALSRAVGTLNMRREHLNHISAAASAGERVPSLPELLDGCAMFRDSVHQDAGQFAAQALDLLDPKDPATHGLLDALCGLTMKPGTKHYVAAAEAVEGFLTQRRLPALAQMHAAERCYLYAALSGHKASMHKVAAYTVARAYEQGIDQQDAIHRTRSAVGWMLAANGQMRLPKRWSRSDATMFLAAALDGPGEQMMTKMLANRASEHRKQGGWKKRPTPKKLTARQALAFGVAEDPAELDDAEEQQTEPDPRRPYAMVFTEVGNVSSAVGQKVLEEYRELLNLRLPLEPVPDLVMLRQALLEEFPHAEAVTDAVLGELVGRPHVALRPLLLVGAPGCGKSTYAVRLAELLDLPCQVYGCGGVADSAFAGTARRWSTSGPSLPVSLMRDHRYASPVVILDEVDKASASKVNGSLLDALLSMLEPRTARCWRDPHLEAPVNLAHVIWLATANDLGDVPAALRDRLHVLRFPSPGPEHISALASRLLVNSVISQGLSSQWALPLDGEELAALTSAWGGGSLRQLARMVGVVDAARNRPDVLH